MSIVSLQTPIREGLKIPLANAHPGSNPGSGTICFQWITTVRANEPCFENDQIVAKVWLFANEGASSALVESAMTTSFQSGWEDISRWKLQRR